MKILYVIDSLASKGGAERILSEKMNYLSTHFGYEVYVISCFQDRSINPNAYYLEDSVKQIDLKIPFYSQYHFKYPKRLWVKYKLYKELCNKLQDVLNGSSLAHLVDLFNAVLFRVHVRFPLRGRHFQLQISNQPRRHVGQNLVFRSAENVIPDSASHL